MSVNVQARGGGGGITLGGNLSLDQVAGTGSPAVWSAGLFLVLLAVVIVVVMGLR